jgi:hypothetical protein
LVALGGLLTIVAAFLPFYSGWGSAFADGLGPVTTLPFYSVVALLAIQGLRATPLIRVLPVHVWRFGWRQVDVCLAGMALALSVLACFANAQGASPSIGVFLSVLGSLIVALGVLVQQLEELVSARVSR